MQPAPSRIARFRGKYYDMGTSNKSFLQLAKDLKRLGIKNFYFMLEIKDITIVGLDPYAVDKNGHTSLTKDQISRIMQELYRNPWYYLREVARIPDQGGTHVPYRANRGNIAQAWCIIYGYDSWLCLPRQQGKTISCIAILVWIYLFGTTNSQAIFLNKDGENAKANLRRMRDQMELLPEYLRFDSYLDETTGKRTKATENATKIENPINKNSVIIKSKATSYDMALSIARGLTAPILYFDEPEFTNHIKTIVSNSVSTFETAAANARKNHAMYGRIFTCTPGDLSTSAGQQAQSILDNTIRWTEKMYDWDTEERNRYIEAQGADCNKIFYIEYHYYQIGKTEEWLKNIAAKIGDPLTVRREILLQRLHGNSLSPYPKEDIEYIVQTEQKPIKELWLLDYFKFDVYTELNPRKPYLAGIDCSSGTNHDNNAITIIDPYTVEPVAEFECSYIGETKFEQLLMELCKILPKVVLCIERNHVGDSVIDHLLHSPYRGRLYFDKHQEYVKDAAMETTTVESMLKKNAAIKTYYGIYTSGQSRDDYFAILARHVYEYKDKFITHNIIRDLTRLVRLPSGKIAAGLATDENGEPFHDDSIMSYLIGLYVYYHGSNLSYFGITPGFNPNEELNTGLRTASEIDPSLVSPELIEYAKKQEELSARKTYEEMMIEAAQKAQEESVRLQKSGLSSNRLIESTPSNYLTDMEYDSSAAIDLSIFDSLNNF